MSNIEIPFVTLSHARDLPTPRRATKGASGFDLYAAVPEHEPISIAPGAHAMIPTGLVPGLPEGYEAQIRPRSGLAAKFAVTVLNSPGTIDADYRGEIHVILINFGKASFVINRADRIAQMVIATVPRTIMVETETLDHTARGTGGFGSTGFADNPQ